MAPIVDLAQELIDHILDFLHDDPISLLSSSLVARNWVPAPRYHIFEKIAINYYFRPGYQLRLDTANGFLATCDSPYSTILPSVHSVVLNISTELDETAAVLLDEICLVLGRAPINKLLFIDHTYSGKPMSLSRIAPHFSGLQEFAYNALDDVAEDLFAVVASFPMLRRLSAYAATPAPHTQLYPSPTAFAYLHTLRLQLSSHESALSWLQSADEPLRLETLDLNIFHPYHNGWGPVGALNSLLHASGEHLRHLSLGVSYKDDIDDDDIDAVFRQMRDADGEVDLSSLANLRTLRLTNHNVDAICSALASLPVGAQPSRPSG
ncbi:hypothetical protein B0H17DRAFT_1102168 [Mycena rosella]|uniref:F-box domain-containing protein n=1 Tax=Mycena rosella TaxID=1033263 RepID=A0AAD7G1R0_MYCRO|nr:hypothetical protein B0H17DRAFT_1102168 [Mycena rosella]